MKNPTACFFAETHYFFVSQRPCPSEKEREKRESASASCFMSNKIKFWKMQKSITGYAKKRKIPVYPLGSNGFTPVEKAVENVNNSL